MDGGKDITVGEKRERERRSEGNGGVEKKATERGEMQKNGSGRKDGLGGDVDGNGKK